MDREARVHRALSSPARSRIVAVLSTADAAMDVEALSERLELHPNTVRAHLSVLQEAGLVSSAPEDRDRPGRPRLIYRAAGTTAEVGSDHGYRFLANVLAGYVAASAEDPAQIGEDAGTSWGRYLVERPAPFETPDAGQAVARVVRLMEESGFDPQLDDTERGRPRLLLRRCPFLEVAKEHPQIVCSIHLGLLRGAFDELGVEVQARDLLPFVEPGLCVSHLRWPSEPVAAPAGSFEHQPLPVTSDRSASH